METSLSFTLNWDVQELPDLQQAIESHAQRQGWSLAFLAQLQLLAEELVTNVMLHGDEGTRDTEEAGWVRLDLTQADDLITLVVTDNGTAFDPTQAPEPDLDAPLELRQRGGLGVYFIRELTDHFSYRREAGCNVVTVQKRQEQQP